MTTKTVVSVGLRDLLDAGMHFGHQTKRWNPKMKPFIFDKRNGIHIIDLTQSIQKLELAARFLRDMTLSGKSILFVATKKQSQDVIQQAAESCGQFYVTQRWLGGMLTNSPTIRRSVQRMRQIEAIARNNNGQLSVHKKEASNLRRELDKLQRNLSGMADLDGLPGAMVVVDVCRESIAIAEANRLGIPVVAIVDTNADPDPIAYPIPGNDDAIRSVKVVIDALSEVIKEAADEYRQRAAEKTRQQEAERVAAQARRQATEKKPADIAAGATGAKRTRLTPEQRKEAASSAQKAVAARLAAATKAKETKPTEVKEPEPATTPQADSATEPAPVSEAAPVNEPAPATEVEPVTEAAPATEAEPAVTPPVKPKAAASKPTTASEAEEPIPAQTETDDAESV